MDATGPQELETAPPTGAPPEPYTALAVQMQSQFAALMAMMQTDRETAALQFKTLADENLILSGEIAHAKTGVPKPSIGLRRPSLDGTPIKPNIDRKVRRSSAFFAATDSGIRAPKALLNGDVFAKMNFCGKPHESLKEHLIKFEYHARNQPEVFWCDLLQLTFNKTISDAIIVEGLIRQGWDEYTELCEWLADKYHREQFEITTCTNILFV